MSEKRDIYNKYFGEGTGRENYADMAKYYAQYIEKDSAKKVSFRVVTFTHEVSEKQAWFIINYVEKNNAIQVMEDFWQGKRYMFNR